MRVLVKSSLKARLSTAMMRKTLYLEQGERTSVFEKRRRRPLLNLMIAEGSKTRNAAVEAVEALVAVAVEVVAVIVKVCVKIASVRMEGNVVQAVPAVLAVLAVLELPVVTGTPMGAAVAMVHPSTLMMILPSHNLDRSSVIQGSRLVASTNLLGNWNDVGATKMIGTELETGCFNQSIGKSNRCDQLGGQWTRHTLMAKSNCFLLFLYII
jgi:hypothetical protein